MDEAAQRQCIELLLTEGKPCKRCHDHFMKVAYLWIRRLYGGNLTPTEIEDAAKDAVIAIWKQRDQCRSVVAFPGWFHTIAKRAAQRLLREDPLEQRPLSLDATYPRPDGGTEKIELPVEDEPLKEKLLLIALEQALRDEKLLTPRQIKIFRLRREEKTFQEIGEIVGSTPNAAKLVLSDAVQKLKRHLEIQSG